jgi:large subunit ribosomal protein L9
MKVILQKTVEKLGHPGDIVEVADGYARNYLVPRGLAVKATRGGVKHIESLKRAHTVRTSKAKGEAEAVASKLTGGPIAVRARVGEEGKLFGSVTAAEVVAEIERQTGVVVDRHDVHLPEPIRSVGTHEVRVHLFQDVDPILSVDVQPES